MKTFLHPALGKTFFKKIFTLFFVLVSLSTFSELKTAICSGDYNNAATWSSSGKPACGDKVFIPAGITVSVTIDENYYAAGCTAAMQFTIAGSLYFPQTNRMYLPCGSEVWVLSGALVDGQDNNNSQRIYICNVEVWSGRDLGAGPLYWSVGVLPIDLLSFDVKPSGKKNIATWITETEQNNDYFEVERSEDGVNFYPIKKVFTKAVNGSSSSALSYEISDEDAPKGRSYYRLRQIDLNAKITFSRIVAIERNMDNQTQFIIYPNPNNGKFFIDLKGLETNKEIEVKFFDSLGKLVHHYFTDAFAIQSKAFDATFGEKREIGVYMVEFTMDKKSYYSKLILQ